MGLVHSDKLGRMLSRRPGAQSGRGEIQGGTSAVSAIGFLVLSESGQRSFTRGQTELGHFRTLARHEKKGPHRFNGRPGTSCQWNALRDRLSTVSGIQI